MAALDDLNALKKAFEREIKKEEETALENEQKLLKAITVYICNEKGVSPIQGYKPEEISSFLEKPIAEIKKCLGSDWVRIPDSEFENLIYILNKKVKKADKLTTW